MFWTIIQEKVTEEGCVSAKGRKGQIDWVRVFYVGNESF